MRANILVRFSDHSAMVYEPTSAVRIVNRGPRSAPYKDFEKVASIPPRYVGFGSFAATILAVGHEVDTHRGILTVTEVAWDADAPPGDTAVTGFLG